MPDLTISIISADNVGLLLPCLSSIFENTHNIELEVYVVDNASADGTPSLVQLEFPQVKVIQNNVRLGFATNNNLVLSEGRGRYLMLLNDDTVVLDGALDRMVAFADEQREAGVVGSFLLNPDNTFQPSFSPFPNPWIEGVWSTAAGFPNLRAGAKEPFPTDTVCGAALMIRRETMDQIGLLDTDFDPIYAEETDWCYRTKKAGWKVYSHPQAQIIHYGSQTMNRIPFRKMELLQGHKALFFRKHHGRVAEGFFKLSLTLASLLRMLIAMARGTEAKPEAQLQWYMSKRALFL